MRIKNVTLKTPISNNFNNTFIMERVIINNRLYFKLPNKLFGHYGKTEHLFMTCFFTICPYVTPQDSATVSVTKMLTEQRDMF